MKLRAAAILAGFLASPAAAQMYDDAALKRWSNVTIVHYEVVGVISDKHVQIPSTDADLYADIVDTVKLSFDWGQEQAHPRRGADVRKSSRDGLKSGRDGKRMSDGLDRRPV